MVFFTGLLAATLFGSAGRWDLPLLWAYMALLATTSLVAQATMDPDLLKERMRPGPGGCDRHLRFIAMPFFAAHLVIAGLDVGRFHFSDGVPLWARLAGLLGMALAMGFTIWAMRVNRFFSPVVRIQSERGHRLVTDGPYARIRHPGYLGAVSMIVFSGLALGSWVSLAPALAAGGLMLRRILLEDRFLHDNLEGYVDYARRVRYRLMPGVW
jgi:protein-S-isoprenylcysteine O-methyltransferase Ste14